eukprot:scaffold20340_cov47-Prasinocladus_malaysianus.AAC.1
MKTVCASGVGMPLPWVSGILGVSDHPLVMPGRATASSTQALATNGRGSHGLQRIDLHISPDLWSLEFECHGDL